MDEHLKFVLLERSFLPSQKIVCNTESGNFYMEIDGMDQSKTNLPHWSSYPKDINKDLLMQIHVTWVRYGDGRLVNIYLSTSQFAHDSAATCTIFYKLIAKAGNPSVIFLLLFSLSLNIRL